MNIVIDHQAQRQLRRVPRKIIRALRDWVAAVMRLSLQEVRRNPGYHDEPLRGKRQDQRSIRLSRQWRAFYLMGPDKLTIHGVTPHEYRVHGAAEVPALQYLNELLGE